MKVYRLIFFLYVSFIGVLLAFAGCDNPIFHPPAPTPKQDPGRTFKLCLFKMKEAGFTLNRDIETDAVYEDWQHTLVYHRDTIAALYIALGDATRSWPPHDFSDCCWHFETRSIVTTGSYVNILLHLRRISKGDLNFEDCRDYCNEKEDGKAWVAFRFAGEEIKWDLKVNEDYVDGELFNKIQDLCKKYHKKGRLTFYPEGQAFVMSYLTADEFRHIRRVTGLKLELLHMVDDVNVP